MRPRNYIKLVGLVMCLTVNACTTVKMPKLDFVKFPEFLEETRNFEAYPKVQEAPEAPNDLRSAEAWDAEARKILALKNASPVTNIDATGTMSSEEYAALKARVQAYKRDDPQ